MDFSFTDEQQQLRHSLQRWLADQYGAGQRRERLAGTRDGQSTWRAMAELGLMAAPLPEEQGGLGGGPVEWLVIMTEFGKALVLEPYANALVAARTLGRANHPLVGALADGSALVALAHAEGHGYDAARTALEARPTGAAWTLHGRKIGVVGAPLASHLLVSARTAGAPGEDAGLSLFLVPAVRSGITIDPARGPDGREVATVHLSGVEVRADELVGSAGAAGELIELACDEGAAMLCAEGSGMLVELVSRTVEYTKVRKQFGVAIGSFQALQHRMADMFMEAEQATSMAYYATAMITASPSERRKAVSAAKAYVGRAARSVAQAAVQLHGGMGMTAEMGIGDYLKRAVALDNEFGNSDWHLARYAAGDG